MGKCCPLYNLSAYLNPGIEMPVLNKFIQRLKRKTAPCTARLNSTVGKLTSFPGFPFFPGQQQEKGPWEGGVHPDVIKSLVSEG